MRLLAFAIAILSTFCAFSLTPADSVNVYFHAAHSRFDPTIGENRPEMANFISKVRKAAASDKIECIVVSAYASPDGSDRANEILACRRCDNISDYIIDQSGINPSLIKKNPQGVAWDRLRGLVEATPDVPSRQAVLNILINAPLSDKDVDGKEVNTRKKLLMALDRGVPYQWMLRNLFPQLRNAVAVTMLTKEEEVVVVAPEPETETVVEPRVEIVEPEPVCQVEEPAPELRVEKVCTNDLMAIKTNLLYDAALMPNLELEWRINDHWSVALEGGIAWWKNDPKHKYYQLAYVSPEVRYHIRPRSRWKGMYTGAFVGGGLYDLENGFTGYMGEGGYGGLSFGYMWTVKKRLLFDAEIGVGYMLTRYKEYEPRDGHYLYMRTKTMNYIGPLKLKFSIGWLFGRVCAPKNKTPL